MPLPSEKKTEVDEERAALANNIAAVLAVASSVEGTLGPKGLDTMLVDRFGDVLVTNSGVTILERMDISHPAARMLVHVAKAQHARVGDGTTTATVMAAAVLKEGMNQISRGVPVSRLLEGIRSAARDALALLNEESRIPVEKLSDPVLARVALTAGRGDEEVARLIGEAARVVGVERMRDPAFRFADIVLARDGVEDRLVEGVVLSRGRAASQMPRAVSPCAVLVLDDGLVPEGVEDEALGTESGFKKSVELRNQFLENLRTIFSLGMNVLFVSGGIDPEAEEILTHSGILAVRRLTGRELDEVAAYTGAKPLKRTGLRRDSVELKSCLGRAERIVEEEGNGLIVISGGGGKPCATLLVGASTRHVTDEKERKAGDAASAFQAAFQGGVVAGGGACELALARKLESKRSRYKSMTSYGLDCVLQGLKQPFIQMAANAGFNPLEKAEAIANAQSQQGKDSLSLDFETGACKDMLEVGVYDPLLVKVHALKSATEVAEAILRINRIIKMRTNGAAGTGVEGEHA